MYRYTVLLYTTFTDWLYNLALPTHTVNLSDQWEHKQVNLDEPCLAERAVVKIIPYLVEWVALTSSTYRNTSHHHGSVRGGNMYYKFNL